jgi:glucose-1-phosphate thymidylyltransferase
MDTTEIERPSGPMNRLLRPGAGRTYMKAVVIAAGEGTRLRPLTEDKPKGMVEIDGKPILTHCFEYLTDLGADELIVVVGYKKEVIVSHYHDEFEGVPITYTHQREPKGIAHALLTAEEHIDDEFMLILGDNIFEANLTDVVDRQREDRADAAFLVEEVPMEEADRYGVCDTNDYGEVTDIVEKPDDPPTNLVLTGFYTFTPAIFHACHLVQPSGRGEYEISDAIDLLLRSGRTIDAVRMDGWRIDVGYPEDRDEAERRLQEQRGETGTETEANADSGTETADATPNE